jgi:hypothetical protein
MIGGTIVETLRLSGRGSAIIEDTMVFVLSTPNGFAAMAPALARSRARLACELATPVASGDAYRQANGGSHALCAHPTC